MPRKVRRAGRVFIAYMRRGVHNEVLVCCSIVLSRAFVVKRQGATPVSMEMSGQAKTARYILDQLAGTNQSMAMPKHHLHV
jgi:hypothetical protein